jgi:hypothetical protein
VPRARTRNVRQNISAMKISAERTRFHGQPNCEAMMFSANLAWRIFGMNAIAARNVRDSREKNATR